MNKITHERQEFEVLPLDRISEITHAKLAGGKIVGIFNADSKDDSFEMRLSDNTDFYLCKASFGDLGIQPLKLLPKKPVEFVGKVTDTIMGSKWIRVPSDVPLGTNLHCTQIIEGSE